MCRCCTEPTYPFEPWNLTTSILHTDDEQFIVYYVLLANWTRAFVDGESRRRKGKYTEWRTKMLSDRWRSNRWGVGRLVYYRVHPSGISITSHGKILSAVAVVIVMIGHPLVFPFAERMNQMGEALAQVDCDRLDMKSGCWDSGHSSSECHEGPNHTMFSCTRWIALPMKTKVSLSRTRRHMRGCVYPDCLKWAIPTSLRGTWYLEGGCFSGILSPLTFARNRKGSAWPLLSPARIAQFIFSNRCIMLAGRVPSSMLLRSLEGLLYQRRSRPRGLIRIPYIWVVGSSHQSVHSCSGQSQLPLQKAFIHQGLLRIPNSESSMRL